MSILVSVLLVCVMGVGMAMLFAKHRGVLDYEPKLDYESKQENIEEVFKCGKENKIYVDVTEEEKTNLTVVVEETKTSPETEQVVGKNNEKQNKSTNKSTKKKQHKKKVKVQKKK